MTLKEAQKQQNKQFIDNCYGQQEQLFAYYIGWHPKLYEGVDLDSATIDFINNHFYEYYVNPKDFDRHFLNILRKVTPIYNNLKAIEFNKRVFNITTDKFVRNITEDTTNDITENGNGSRDTHNNGTIGDDFSSERNLTENETSTGAENKNSDNKNANRKLPMVSNGSSFDGLFGWGAGASDITETKDITGTNTTGSVATTTKDDLKSTNIRGINTRIQTEDVNQLKRLGKIALKNKDKREEVKGQAVNLIKNIWDYLILPKSIDYLCSELESAFILIV